MGVLGGTGVAVATTGGAVGAGVGVGAASMGVAVGTGVAVGAGVAVGVGAGVAVAGAANVGVGITVAVGVGSGLGSEAAAGAGGWPASVLFSPKLPASPVLSTRVTAEGGVTAWTSSGAGIGVSKKSRSPRASLIRLVRSSAIIFPRASSSPAMVVTKKALPPMAATACSTAAFSSGGRSRPIIRMMIRLSSARICPLRERAASAGRKSRHCRRFQ